MRFYLPMVGLHVASPMLNLRTMSFTVRMGTDLVAVEAGATVPLNFEVANRSDEQDRFEISVEGLDPEWVAIPVPTFNVDPRDVHEEKVFLKPPRVSESLAGDYPYVLKVRSLNSGDSRSAQGVLSVKPYHHLSIELSPKKGVISAFRKQHPFDATLMNLGNTEHSVQLFASDPEDELSYEFSQDQITLAPGQTKTVEILPMPSKSQPISGTRLHGFSVGARSQSAPSVVCSAQAQLEVRPVLSPGTILLIIFAGLLFFGWLRFLPKPPSIDSLSLDRSAVYRGDMVRVAWRASNATEVRITVNGQVLAEGAEPEGSRTFVADQSGTIEALAIRENKESTPVSRPLTVQDPPVFPLPKIEAFDIQPRNLKLGQSFLVKYKVNGAVVNLTLSPPGIDLDPKLQQKELTANVVGEITYDLVAENAAKPPVVVRRSIKVSVIEASKAAIIKFEATPLELPEEGGLVLVKWQVANAVRIELSDAKQTQVLDGDRGEKSLFIDIDTDLTLSAYDDQGLILTRKIKIRVVKPPSDATTGATTGGTIVTTGRGAG